MKHTTQSSKEQAAYDRRQAMRMLNELMRTKDITWGAYWTLRNAWNYLNNLPAYN